MQRPSILLGKLGLTESEIGVYLSMCRGTSRVQDIIKTSSLKRPTVYYAIARLQERGLVHRTGKDGTERFAVEPPEKLLAIAQRQADEAAALKKEIASLAPSLAPPPKAGERPHVAFYEGVSAVKNVIMETLYCRGRHIDSIAPTSNFFWQVGGSFASEYVAERSQRKISTRNLWESGIDPKRYKKQLYEGISEIRVMPKVMHGKFATTIFLYDDKTLSISSLENAYALLVTSQEHHDTMKAMFEGIWTGATKT